MALAPGQVLQNRYRITALLGTGGMGAVYRAWDLRLEKSVALKELMPQPGLAPDALAQLKMQFRQEAVVLGKLKHANLVPVTDYFEEHSNDYLVMEFVEGESLSAFIVREGALPETQVVSWARQLLDALRYCHAQGVLHRDIKPQNVIIAPTGEAVLVDFGLVKLWDPANPMTRTVMRGVGTPEYAPPEQWGALSHHTDPRSDLYSLGATLYHALAGKAPPTASDRMAYPGQFRTPREWAQRVSEPVDLVITRAMALSCDDRWPDAGAMDAALAAASIEAQAASSTAGRSIDPVSASVSSQAPMPARAQDSTMPMFDAAAAPPGRHGSSIAWSLWVILGIVLIVIVLRALSPQLEFPTMTVPTLIPTRRPAGADVSAPPPEPTRPIASPTAGEALRIALLAPMSGDVAAFGQPIYDGAMLAADKWNARGGVDGRAIELIVEDSGCNANQAISAANKVIVEDAAKFIIGEVCSSASIPISDIVTDADVLQISPTSTNPSVTVAADGSTKPTVFRACFIDAFQGRAGARFASETLGASTAAVFLDEGDTYVTSLAEVFAAEFEAAGGQVVARESYASADGDFTEILSSVRDANPDVLYLPDYYDTVNLIARQAREMGIEAVLLGGDGWDSSDLDLGAMEGGYFTSHFSPDDDREVVQRFVA
ncbi:MAG: ABC transporter substrate-binding protein, partial [Anaerolineae bacterium]|nr:ABC transporter substrate-binding protein [Anaerolineae bacterium]